MRILHVSDLHYTLPQLDWVVEAAADVDLVVLAGDQLDIASAVPLTAQIAVISRYLSLLAEAGHVVVSSGNHDLTGPDDAGEQAALWFADVRAEGIPADHDSVLIDDVLVTVCPFWDGPVGKEAVAAQLAADAARRPAHWIWVYHWPPVGSPTCWTGRRSYGDDELGGWIDQHRPDLVLTGHVHQPPFLADGSWADRIGDTWVLNPGRQRGPMPSCIDIDLATGEVCWSSMMGREVLHLDDPAAPERTVF